MEKGKEYIEPGIIFTPYTFKTIKTSINSEVVWYSNPFKNFLLKIKRFFIKPKYLKDPRFNIKVNPKYFRTMALNNN